MVSVAEVREIDIRYKATGVSETVDLLNRLIKAEEGVVVVGEKVERSDASLSRGLEALKGRYVENYRAVQQVTRDINLLHEARARDLISVNQYQAALGGMQAKLSALPSELKRVQQAQGEVARGWAGMSAPATGAYAAMQANIKAIETRIAAQQRAEEKLRGLGQPPRPQPAAPSGPAPSGGTGGKLGPHGINQILLQGYDIVPQALSGVNPLTILLQQGPQVAQVWQQAGVSAGDALKEVGSKVLGLLTPVRVLTAGIGAIGVAAVAAYSSWLDQQKQLEASLGGVGRGTGATARQLNDVAVANAQAAGLSNAAARELAGTYAATGRIGKDVLGDLIAITRDYAATTRQEMSDAAEELARAFADPAKGAEILNARLGTLDAKTLETITHLSRIGDAQGAQRELYEAVARGADKASERLTLLGRVWHATKVGFSDAWTGLFELPALQAELTRLEAVRDAAQRGVYGPRGAGNAIGGNKAAVDQANKAIEEIRREIDKADKQAAELKANRDSLTAADLARQYNPSFGSRSEIEDAQKRVNDLLQDGAVRAKLSADQISALEEAYRRLTAAAQSFISPAEKAKQLYDLDLAAIGARSPQQRAEIEARRARIQAAGDPRAEVDPETAATRARARVLEQGREDDRRYREQQGEGRRRQIEGAQNELRAIGATASETDRLRRLIELTNEARQRAYELTGDYNKADLSGLEREADAWAKLQQSIREAEAAKRAVDETKLLRFSPDERAIRGQFETDDAGEIISAKDRMTAAQLRYNKAVMDGQDAARGLGKELLDAAKKGDWKAMLTAPLERISGFFEKQITDQFDNAISAKIPGLFGAPRMSGADVRAMSAATMNVTAATVHLNGAGLSGGLLNDNAPGGYGGLLKSNAAAGMKDTMTGGAPAANSAQAFGPSEWLRYANAGATRSQPLDPKLVNAMSFLQEKGIRMDVFSGGQPGVGQGGPRTGSTRHDHGMAADVFFSKDGRRLDWANPRDTPVFQDIVREARARGVTGFGAGPGYMQPGSMHLGFGKPGVWGAGGRGANAPSWLREAYAAPAPNVSALPEIKVDGLQQSFNTLQQSTATLAQNAIPQATQGLGGLGQQATGLGGIFQSLLSGLGGGGAAGGGGSIFTSLLSGLFGGAFAGGTENLPANKINLVGEQGPELLIGNKVIPHRRSMQMIAQPAPILQPVYAPPGGSGGGTKMEVHVHNAPPGTRVEESTDAKGNRRADVMFDDMQARTLSNPKSRTSRALSSTFGSQAVQRKFG